jgi:cardiolipin synthase
VGSVLDPLADKLLLVTSYVCLGLSQVLPWWLTLLVLLRDALIVGGALLYRVLVGALQMRPSLLGKASTLAQIILVLAVLLELSWLPGFAEVRPLLIVTVLLLTLCSGLHYVWAWTRLYRRQRKGVTL